MFSVVVGLGSNFLTRVGSSQFFDAQGWVWSANWLGFGFGKFPQKCQIYQFFYFWVDEISLS